MLTTSFSYHLSIIKTINRINSSNQNHHNK